MILLNFCDFLFIFRKIFPASFPFPDAPLVSVSPNKITLAEGNSLLLTCNASGEPKPSISWTRIGSSTVLSVLPSLTIVNVSRPGTADNMIQYQCTASNGVGTPATATIDITVVCKNSSIICAVTAFCCPLNSSDSYTTCSRNSMLSFEGSSDRPIPPKLA